MPRLICLDTYYQPFLETLNIDQSATYESQLQSVLARAFGTGDFVTRNLRALGWTAEDVILNCEPLQRLWARENTGNPFGNLKGIALEQIEAFRPDVVFLQDTSWFDAAILRALADNYLLAAQISCPMPPLENVKTLACVFSSFPHYVRKFEELKVRAIYNPLAFEPSVIDVAKKDPRWNAEPRLSINHKPQQRIYDCTFVGGVGAPSHWRYGMEVLNAVAEAIPTFRWWGYGAELLPDGPLKQKYYGPAFGVDMYKILLQSKIVLNRHGEVAEGFANNMRMYEATGCGALLLTEYGTNLSDLFACSPKMHAFGEGEVATYESPAEAVDKIRYYLEHEDERAAIAARGQQGTLKDHTYAKRMKVVSDVLQEMLCPA